MAVSKGSYLYLVKHREFSRLGDNVYKVGFSGDLQKRMRAYPKGSLILMSKRVRDGRKAETEVCAALCARYTQRTDLGREYFEGPLGDVLRTCDEIANRHASDAVECPPAQPVESPWTHEDDARAGETVSGLTACGRDIRIVKHYCDSRYPRHAALFALMPKSGVMRKVRRCLHAWAHGDANVRQQWAHSVQRLYTGSELDDMMKECREVYREFGCEPNEPVMIFEGGLCKDVEAKILHAKLDMPEVVAFDEDVLLVRMPAGETAGLTRLMAVLDGVCDKLGLTREKRGVGVYKVRRDVEELATACVQGWAEVYWDELDDDVAASDMVAHAKSAHGFPTFEYWAKNMGRNWVG